MESYELKYYIMNYNCSIFPQAGRVFNVQEVLAKMVRCDVAFLACISLISTFCKNLCTFAKFNFNLTNFTYDHKFDPNLIMPFK